MVDKSRPVYRRRQYLPPKSITEIGSKDRTILKPKALMNLISIKGKREIFCFCKLVKFYPHHIQPVSSLFRITLSVIFFTNGVTTMVIGKPITNVVKNMPNHTWKKFGTVPILIIATAIDVSKDIIEPIMAPNNNV